MAMNIVDRVATAILKAQMGGSIPGGIATLSCENLADLRKIARAAIDIATVRPLDTIEWVARAICETEFRIVLQCTLDESGSRNAIVCRRAARAALAAMTPLHLHLIDGARVQADYDPFA